MFKDKVLLITGGTGSFGNAVLKRFIDSDLREIRIFSRDEKKQDDMRNIYKSHKIKFYIGDVRSFDSIDYAMQGVDYVFHAAALKQVPACEFFPMEAVKTNVMGTDNLLRSAIKNKVKKVVCLSTDKAAYPINAMGTSKAMMEKVMVSHSRNTDPQETLICGTRYGNVMASRGSVIPLFVSQIKSGQPLTITEKSMTRFLLSLDDAVELVLYAFKNAKAGDILVQKAPASTIGELAQAVLQLFNSQQEIKIIGTRHGEKQYETLVTKEEMARADDLGNYLRINADTRDLRYDKYFSEGSVRVAELAEYNSNNTEQIHLDKIKELLLSLDYIKEELKSL